MGDTLLLGLDGREREQPSDDPSKDPWALPQEVLQILNEP